MKLIRITAKELDSRLTDYGAVVLDPPVKPEDDKGWMIYGTIPVKPE